MQSMEMSIETEIQEWLMTLVSYLTWEFQLVVHIINVAVGVELCIIDLVTFLEPTSLWTFSWVSFIIFNYAYILNCFRSLFESICNLKSKVKYNKEVTCKVFPPCSYYNFCLFHFALSQFCFNCYKFAAYIYCTCDLDLELLEDKALSPPLLKWRTLVTWGE